MASSSKAATATAPSTEPASSTKGKGGKKLLLALLIGLPLVVGAAGGGAWYYREQAKAASEHDDGEEKPEKAAETKVPSKAPIFVTLEPFTVNLSEIDAERYLQVGIVFEAADSGAVDAINQHMPIIRNRILLLLSSKRAADLESADGKQRLATEIIAAAREPLGKRGRQKSVEDVYFSSFVIQ